MTIEEVIAELEKASEGSQRLDVLVCCAAFDISFKRGEEYLRWANQPFMGVTKLHEFYETLRSFTRSLDAAMTLVPEGWRVEKLSERQDDKWDCCLVLWRNPKHASLTVWGDEILTAALALCIAALRARSRQP